MRASTQLRVKVAHRHSLVVEVWSIDERAPVVESSMDVRHCDQQLYSSTASTDGD